MIEIDLRPFIRTDNNDAQYRSPSGRSPITRQPQPQPANTTTMYEMKDLYSAFWNTSAFWLASRDFPGTEAVSSHRSFLLALCSTSRSIDWCVEAECLFSPIGAANTPLSGHFRCINGLIYCMASTKLYIVVGHATNYISLQQEKVAMQSGELKIAFSTNSISGIISSCQDIIDPQKKNSH